MNKIEHLKYVDSRLKFLFNYMVQSNLAHENILLLDLLTEDFMSTIIQNIITGAGKDADTAAATLTA